MRRTSPHNLCTRLSLIGDETGRWAGLAAQWGRLLRGFERRSSFGDALGIEPGLDLGGIESDELADLEEGDPSLCDEATDEAIGDSEPVSELLDAEQ